MKQHAPAYWPTRIMLAVGFIMTAMLLALALALGPVTQGPGLFEQWPVVLGLPADVVGRLAGLVPALVGIVWMLRIFRGPRDEPPGWRYRDR